MAWLEHFLESVPGTVVAITHDRYFLDSEVVWFEGNYGAPIDDLRRRKGAGADQPHRIKFKPLVG